VSKGNVQKVERGLSLLSKCEIEPNAIEITHPEMVDPINGTVKKLIHIALLEGYSEIAQLLYDPKNKYEGKKRWSIWHFAAYGGCIKFFDDNFDHCSDINIKTGNISLIGEFEVLVKVLQTASYVINVDEVIPSDKKEIVSKIVGKRKLLLL